MPQNSPGGKRRWRCFDGFLRFKLAILLLLFCIGSPLGCFSHSVWQEIFLDLPDPRGDAARCGLEKPTTEFSLCDPEKVLQTPIQSEVADNLRTLQATRFHECQDGTTPPIHLAVWTGPPNFASNVANKIDFVEDILELTLEKASSSENKPVERVCGSYIAAFIASTSCPPILAFRCDRAKEPLFRETEYPEMYKELWEKMQLNATCTSITTAAPQSRQHNGNELQKKEETSNVSFLQRSLHIQITPTLEHKEQGDSKTSNKSPPPAGPVPPEVAISDIIDFFMERFPVRAEPLPLPPAQESLEEKEEQYEEVEEIVDGRVVIKKVPKKEAMTEELVREELLKKKALEGVGKGPLAAVKGQVAGAFKGEEELVGAVEEVPNEALKGTLTAPTISKNMWKYFSIVAIFLLVWTVLMEILHQVLKRRLDKYAMPFSSEINVDVLAAGAPELFTSNSMGSPTDRSARRKHPSRSNEVGRHAFGERGHPERKRKPSTSQPPPISERE